MVLELDKLHQTISTKCKAYIYPATSKYSTDMVELVYQDPYFTAKEIEKIADEIASFGVNKDKIKIVPTEREIKITATIHINHVSAFGINLSELAKEIMKTIGSTYHVVFRAIRGVENYISIKYHLNYADLKELERIPKLIELITNFANKHGKRVDIRRDYDENAIWFSIMV